MSPKRITKPVDVYVRVSRVAGREGDSFQSPKQQRGACVRALEARGLKPGIVVDELDVSGGKRQKPELEKLLARVEAGESAGIIVAKVDRFSRTLVGALSDLQRLDEAGGVFLTADGELDTSSATGELILRILLSLADFELRRIRESWDTAQRNARGRGVYISPRTPFGYRRLASGAIEPDPTAAELVRTVYRMRARGERVQACADYLNTQGARTPVLGDGSGPTGGGNRWTESTVRKLIENELYAEGAPELPEEFGAKLRLVPRSMWRKAQPRKDGRRRRREEHLLAGLVRCGSCGGVLTASKIRKVRRDGSENVQSHYRCRQRAVDVRPCERPVIVSGALLEPFVVDLLFPQGATFRGMLTHDAGDAAELVAERAAAEAELTEVEALRGRVSPSAFAVALSDAEAAVTAARSAVAENGLESREIEVPAEVERDHFERLPVARQRAIIRDRVGVVTVMPRKPGDRVTPIAARVTVERPTTSVSSGATRA